MATVAFYEAGVGEVDVRRRLSAFYPAPEVVTKTVTVTNTVYVQTGGGVVQQSRATAQRYDVPLKYRAKFSPFAGRKLPRR